MQPRITVVTLGVSDLARSRAFYCEGLGWMPAGGSNEHITFIQAGALVLALFPRKLLAEDAKVELGGPGFGGITLAQNLPTKAAVDAALSDAVRAGGKLLKAAQDVFWGGYSGYFADPDGHAWEVAFNPFWKLDASGQVILPPA